MFHLSDPTAVNQCLTSGETVFDLAQPSNVTHLLTAAPNDYYPESEWHDDMELGATEMYNATALGCLPSGLPYSDPSFYLQKAATWANAYITGPNDGGDTLNLSDVSGLAHYLTANYAKDSWLRACIPTRLSLPVAISAK